MLGTAVRRAAHQLYDRPRIYDDPIIVRLVPEARDESMLATLDLGAPKPELLRGLFAMRTRFAEDRLADAVKRGVRQYVSLGAGLDTFPWRQSEFASGLQLFLVDHPVSSTWCQERIRRHGLLAPPNLEFVPVDFENQRVEERLHAHGFNAAAPAYCVALGVQPFLNSDAVDELLRFAAALKASSELVLSFCLPDDALKGEDLDTARYSGERMNKLGEPWLSRFRPREMIARIRQFGFRQIFHLSPDMADERYFANRDDGLRAPVWEQLVSAIV